MSIGRPLPESDPTRIEVSILGGDSIDGTALRSANLRGREEFANRSSSGTFAVPLVQKHGLEGPRIGSTRGRARPNSASHDPDASKAISNRYKKGTDKDVSVNERGSNRRKSVSLVGNMEGVVADASSAASSGLSVANPSPFGATFKITSSVVVRLAASEDTRDLDRQLDQYYTRQDVADRYYEVLKRYADLSAYFMVEPSAGTGSFYRLLPVGSFGFDVDPKYQGIITADFLTVEITSVRPVAILGNPPFGKKSGTAVRFFNHAARQSALIAFILPRTFRKASIQNRLDRDFHLVHEEDVPADAFLFRGKPYDVPAVFQIWKRKPRLRTLRLVETRHPDFEFCTKDDADFVIQRVGAQAGRIHFNFEASPASHYFIRGPVLHIMLQLPFASVAGNVAGNPSLAKSEMVALYREFTEQ